jgi:dolichyl-phosphate beta-glucosyltransferase
MTTPDISMIVPAYNEEDLILGTLDGLQDYFKTRNETYEIIVVDDGSRDKTVPLVEEWRGRTGVDLRLLVNEKNMGKGFSVRRGVEESFGKYLIFIDADLPYELDAIEGFLNTLRGGYDLAIGSRVVPGSAVTGVPPLRFFAGQVFSWMVQFFLLSQQ